jgi:hypothetical protein
MGVGKTAELERIHRQAIKRTLDVTDASVPVFLHAREIGGASLESLLAERVSGYGDPSRVGVHLVVDGLDEAGIRVSEMASRAATLMAIWPNSTVVMASRPDSSQPDIPTVVVEPLSQEMARDLMALLDPTIDRWPTWRAELTEVLRRPLFAIRYALDHRKGSAAAVSEAQLVDSVGRHAVDDIADNGEQIFDLLTRLACHIIDTGGQPAELRGLGATPVQIWNLARSRILHSSDGRASFQLAVLTEWFAANALLRDDDVLSLSVSSALRSHRWRYALVQAILQGSSRDVDRIMSTLLNHAPAAAAWVHYEARSPFRQERTVSPAATAIEAGERVRNAASAWIEPWPRLIERWSINGDMRTLGVSLEGTYLITAWRSVPIAVSDRVVPLPPHVHPLRSDDPAWTGQHAGRPASGENWPWVWTLDAVQREIDTWLKDRDLLESIEVCWPELAWDYAHHILGKSPDVQSTPILCSDLTAAIAEVRAHVPDGEVYVEVRGNRWILSEAESFVRDLQRLHINEIRSPWPPANARGSWRWDWWTTDQLLARLHVTTKAALDAYQSIVQLHLPTMAAELDTYQLLPARVIGKLTPRRPGEGYESQPGYVWYLEPLPAGSSNDAQWQISETYDNRLDSDWAARIAAVRALRGDVAERIRLLTHGGEPHVLSPTPAGSLALALLADDLYAFKWSTGHGRVDANSNSVPPKYAP